MKQPRRDGLAHPAAAVFPGGIAGASLKRSHYSGVAGAIAAVVFPGGIAGASLKRGPMARRGRGGGGFPRRNRRGLIEA